MCIIKGQGASIFSLPVSIIAEHFPAYPSPNRLLSINPGQFKYTKILVSKFRYQNILIGSCQNIGKALKTLGSCQWMRTIYIEPQLTPQGLRNSAEGCRGMGINHHNVREKDVTRSPTGALRVKVQFV